MSITPSRSRAGIRPGAVSVVAALLLGLCFWVAPATLSAQQASLEVVVLEAISGAPAVGREVSLDNASVGLHAAATTNAQGKVRFNSLSTAGLYRVSVAETEATYAIDSGDLSLRANVDRSVTLSLAPKEAVTENLAVVEGAGVAQINTVNAEVSSSLREEEIESLPVEGRDVTRALFRLPNVTQATGFYPEAPNVSINGANSLFANYLLDGLDNNENFLGGQKFAAPVGMTSDVTVLTNNYSTEFGRTGNGVINLTSRSGGNALHGEAFYLTRPGPSIDSSSPFAQRDLSGNQVKDGFRRNQGGLSLGGAIEKDRTFYFLNAETTKDDKDNLLTSPALGVSTTVPGTNDFTYLSGRLDRRWNDSLRSTFRANVGEVGIERQGGGLDGGATFPSAGNTQDRNSLLVAANNSWIGNSWLSETNLQYSRFRWNYADPENPESPQVAVLDPQEQTIAVLGHPGFVFDDLEKTWQVQQKVSLSRERHTWKAGAELLSADFALAGGGNPNGNYTVKLTPAQLAALRARNLGAGLSVGDIPGDVQVLAYNIEMQPNTFGKRQQIGSVYVEDLFSASARLNLTFGLRYDYDNLSKGGSRSGDKDNFAPRFNFNYQLNEKSAIRGGYGIFYDKILYAIYSDALQQNSTSAGFRSQVEQLIARGILPRDTDLSRIFFDGNLSASFNQGVTYLQGPRPDLSQRERIVSNELRILNPNGYDNPYTQQASLGYQLQLDGKTLFYADLVSARSYDLFRLRDLNAPAPYPIDPNRVVVRTSAQADATRPVGVVPGGARNIVVTETGGRSEYEGLSLNLVKDRGGDRWSYRLSYTLSRLRNDTEDINFRAQDSNDFEAEWGPSINDRRHVINALVFLDPLPDLTVTLAALVQSGQPINRIPDAALYGTTDLNGDGRSFGDAYVGNSDRSPGESRNSDRLPWSKTFDLGLQYRLPLLSRRIEVRADVFNLTNEVNLSGYSNNSTQSNQIQVGPKGSRVVKKNAGPPRQFQFGLRYSF